MKLSWYSIKILLTFEAAEFFYIDSRATDIIYNSQIRILINIALDSSDLMHIFYVLFNVHSVHSVYRLLFYVIEDLM